MVSKKRINKLIPNIVEVSLVDAGCNPFADVLLAKRRDGSEIGIRFTPLLANVAKGEPVAAEARARFARRRMKRNVAKTAPTAVDLAAIARQALARSPVNSEDFANWSRRVYGAQLGSFTSLELKVARYIFELAHRAAAVKTTAAEAINQLAKARAAETGKLFETAYREVAGTPLGSELCSMMRKRVVPPPPQSVDAENATNELRDIVARIQKSESMSSQQAFTAACQRFPDLYEKCRGRSRHG
ncbi:MAG TPA: hypothetical protein VG328_05470 [Stellaceae bacterium]|jgi:hypothetical protein|nr:hypothetical protein [Stellaceae bacterium]